MCYHQHFFSVLECCEQNSSRRPAELLDKVSPTLGGGLAKALPTGKETTVLDIASGFTVPLAREGINRATRSILAKRTRNINKRFNWSRFSRNTLPGIIGRMESIARYRGFLDPTVARLTIFN